MRKSLLPYLICPKTKAPLVLVDAHTDATGNIISGFLTVKDRPEIIYPIIHGIPRFVLNLPKQKSVYSFGEQWNHFNFKEFSKHFAEHSIKNTFGGFGWFKDKIVIDCGAGSGMQTRWLALNGAKLVIALELSHSVDGVIQENLTGIENAEIIQCSIDAIPLKTAGLGNLVMCSNVIQHTPSVQNTLTELWRITPKGAEMCFNVYTRNDETMAQRLRHRWYLGTRWVVSKLPFILRLGYAHLMAVLWFVPGLGKVLEKADMLRSGAVPAPGKGWAKVQMRYRATVLNTFDYFGAHAYQHHCSFTEIQAMVDGLKPKVKLLNQDNFFKRPQPIGVMLRLKK